MSWTTSCRLRLCHFAVDCCTALTVTKGFKKGFKDEKKINQGTFFVCAEDLQALWSGILMNCIDLVPMYSELLILLKKKTMTTTLDSSSSPQEIFFLYIKPFGRRTQSTLLSSDCLMIGIKVINRWQERLNLNGTAPACWSKLLHPASDYSCMT